MSHVLPRDKTCQALIKRARSVIKSWQAVAAGAPSSASQEPSFTLERVRIPLSLCKPNKRLQWEWHNNDELA